MDTTSKTALQRAADEVGVPAIAAACDGISVQAVYKWLRKGQAPAVRCEAISRATGGRVTVLELLPPSLRAAVAPGRAGRSVPSVSGLKQ